MKHISSLDGIRGIAIYLVLLFHATLISGGFIGVDVFFTLSGFLITSLLLCEWEKAGRIDLSGFYWRRSLRLLPAILMLILVSWLLDIGPKSIDILFAVLFYYANIYRAVIGENHLGIFEHTWSLSIEEQFYLCWPSIILLLLRNKLSRKALTFAIFCMICSVNIWRLWLWIHGVPLHRLYNGTDTRFDSILWGCALACGLPMIERIFHRLPRAFVGIPIILIGWMACFLQVRNQAHLIIAFALVPFLTCLLIGIAISQQVKFLEAKPLVALGKVSYGLYVWHPLVLILCVNQKWSNPKILAGFAIGSALFTITSYYLIERPFLQLKNRIPMRQGQGDLRAVDP